MGIPVKLEAFEGPLDLLLHLIEKNKVDIYDIPIVLITEQYLDYVSKMDTKDMDVMSEFLVMAATLVRIKSKMLLPVEEEEEEEFEDPRQELVERILEYKMYKYASYELKDRQVDAGRMVFKEPSIPEEIQDFKEDVAIEDLLSDVTLAKLQGIFNSVMKKQVDKIDPIRSKFGEIEKEEISLEDHIVFLDSYAKEHKTFSFRKLLENGSGKTYVIVTFLGILEMMKMGKLTIVQENIFDDILITYREKEDKRKEREEEKVSIKELEAVIEAILFTMGEAVEVERIAAAVEHDEDTIRRLIRNMMTRYEEEDRGIRIIELDGSFQLCTKPEMYEYLIKVAHVPKKHVLTDVMLETLSIIAYKQPITRIEIEKIRGVKCDHAVNKLIEYNLICEAGRLDAPGRPILFATTEEFLRYFGIESLEELPILNQETIDNFKEEAEREVMREMAAGELSGGELPEEILPEEEEEPLMNWMEKSEE